MMLKISRVLLLVAFLPSAAAQVRGARMTDTTKFSGFVRNEIQVVADSSDSKPEREVIRNMNKRRLNGFVKGAPKGAGSFASSQPVAVSDAEIQGRSKQTSTTGKSSGKGGKGSESSTRVNFVQDVYDTALAVNDFDDATTPTLKEEGTVFTFRNFTFGSDQTSGTPLFASGVCTRTETQDGAFRAVSYCDFTYSMQDALLSGFSASGALLDAYSTITGGFSGGGIMGVTGGTGLYFGVSGEVQVTPFFTTTSTSGDLFLDAAFYSVNATLFL